MGASWRARQTLLLPFLKNPRKINISQLRLVVAPARKGEGRKEKGKEKTMPMATPVL